MLFTPARPDQHMGDVPIDREGALLCFVAKELLNRAMWIRQFHIPCVGCGRDCLADCVAAIRVIVKTVS